MTRTTQPKATRNKTTRRKAAKRTAVVVLSMHRSGTSALTRVLGLLGCALPKTLVAARKNDNDSGFWESQAVVDVNEAICASTGSNWNDWVSLSPGWRSSPVKAGFVDQAHEALEQEFGDSRLFVLKDPRLCRLMPVWAEALERFNARPLYVMPVRNPLEVAASLRKRNQLLKDDSHLAWLRHMLDAERYSRGQPRVYVRYADLLDNWRKTVERISGKLDLAWPNLSVSVEDEVDSFLVRDLRHHNVEDAHVFEGTLHSPWIRQCFDVVNRWARDEFLESDAETLDRISGEMDAVVPSFGRLVDEVRSLGKERRQLARRLEAAEVTEQKLQEADGALEKKKKELGEVANELEKQRGQVKERDQRVAAANLAARKHKEALGTAQVELNQSEANLRIARVELADSNGRLSRIDGELVRKQAELDTAKGELERLRGELKQRDERLDVAVREHLAALSAVQVELGQSEGNLRIARVDLADSRDRLSKTDGALAQERAELEIAKSGLGKLRVELKQRDEQLDLAARKHREALEALQAEVAQSEGNLRIARAELADSRDRQSRTDSALANEREKLEIAKGNLGKLRGELKQRDERLDLAVRKHRDALEAVRGELGQSEESLRTTRAELADSLDRLSRTDKALARTGSELEAAKSELELLREAIKERDERLEAANNATREHREALGAVRAELEDSEANLHAARGQLGQLRGELQERVGQLRSLELRRASEQEEARLAIYQASEEASDRLARQESALATARAEITALRAIASEAEANLTLVRAERQRESRQRQQENKRNREQLKKLAAGHSAVSRALEESRRRSTEVLLQARGLLNDHMQRLLREISPPAPGVLARLNPLGRSQHMKTEVQLEQVARELRDSDYFDAEWYLARNPDVAKAGMDPALHFIQHGFEEGRAPSARFEDAQ